MCRYLDVLLAGDVQREELDEAVVVQNPGQRGRQLPVPATKVSASHIHIQLPIYQQTNNQC